LLDKLMLYDKELSANRNEACTFCHMPEAGFTGPVSELNRTTGSYPGSVRLRFGNRKPQSHAYAPLSSALHYNPGQGDLVGGNFWDMRATGRRLGNPAAEQAEAPPTNPVEMGWPALGPTDNMNTSRVGHLGPSDAEEDAVVNFMHTLSDRFMHVNPQ
jgi:cytochrome c peroxidase